MRRTTVLFVLAVLLIPVCVYGQSAMGDFNWLPSGKLVMGDEKSEARFKYWCDSPEMKGQTLALPGGTNAGYQGRIVTKEQFAVPVATWRGGPCGGDLVIRKVWDTGLPETALKVTVEGQELVDWTVPKIDGDRRWVNVFYVVPQSVVAPKDEKGNARAKWKINVSLTTERTTPSYGYACFVTKDWQILGEEFAGPLNKLVAGKIRSQEAYVNALVAFGMGDYESAISTFRHFGNINEAENPKLADIARLGRRMLRLCEYKKIAITQPRVEISEEISRSHYLLGLYCTANGFWEEALEEFTKAVTADPTNPEATYRLGEAMDYNRLPVEEWAPLMERAGDLWKRPDFNTADIFVPIQTQAYEGRTGKFSKGSMDALYRDWRTVEQQVWGASRGMYKLRTHYRTYGADDVKWDHDGWAIHPPEEEWGEWGTYDQSVITAEYGDSGACGPDVGFRGCGYAQIGPTRGWEVLMHEWNHEFDWTGISGETLPGYPVTHDSDGCGKEPIVSMGCGHRSSMTYYITPAMYRRHETSDLIVPGSLIKIWAVGGMTEFKVPAGLEDDELGKWIVEENVFNQQQIDGWKGQWQREWDENEKKAENERQKMETWNERLMRMVKQVRILDKCGIKNEADVVVKPGPAKFKTYESPTDFVDLMKVYPNAPEKCVAYAETYVWSPKDQEVRMWLGMNDGMRVWLNGRNIHKGRYYSIVNWDDKSLPNTVGNSAKLMKGWNRFVVKVDRLGGGWGFSIALVTFDNEVVDGLKLQAKKPNAAIAKYERPEIGKRYNWDDVRDDYTELLPTLSAEDVREITGLKTFDMAKNEFFFTTAEVSGSRVIEQPDNQDRDLNNYLNWNWEAAAAVRYQKNGETRDLIFVRPEYYEEFVRLLPGNAVASILGTTCTRQSDGYPRRFVLVIDGKIEGEYPLDEQELLEIRTE